MNVSPFPKGACLIHHRFVNATYFIFPPELSIVIARALARGNPTKRRCRFLSHQTVLMTRECRGFASPRNDSLIKITCPCISAGTGSFTSCGATWLGASRPLNTYIHTLTLSRRVFRLPYSVSHTFLIALRSPFGFSSSAAIPPSAALCATSDKAYSLFVIGLADSFVLPVL